MAVEGRSERRTWKCNNNSTESGITDRISCDKNIFPAGATWPI